MYKKMIGALVLFALIVGCQPVEFEMEPHEPVSSFTTNEAAASESAEDTRPLYISNAKPRQLYVAEQSSLDILSPTINYCWSEGPGECVDEFKYDPMKVLADYRDPLIKPSSNMYYNMVTNDGPNSPLPFPTTLQLFAYQDGTLTPLGEEVSDTEAWEIPFVAPAEEGKYVYVVKATYEGDVNGVTFYAFHFRVRNK